MEKYEVHVKIGDPKHKNIQSEQIMWVQVYLAFMSWGALTFLFY